MSGTKFYQKSEDADVTEFIKNTFMKRECNGFSSEANQYETEICECGYSKNAHSSEESDHSELLTKSVTTDRKTVVADIKTIATIKKTVATDAFGKLDFVEGKEKSKLSNKRYVRLDYKTEANKILKLFDIWKMEKPDIILSVISDSDYSTDEGNEVIEAMSNGPIQNIRKRICSHLLEAAALTNAWIITGGLSKGVDQLIGTELKQRLADEDDNPKVVLGISNWGCLAKKKKLLNDSFGPNGYASDSNKVGFSLNQHHTHFLLVDDGTQKNSGCECVLRKLVECALTKRETKFNKKGRGRPMIYILIGGSINAFSFVRRALENRIPVIIAMGSGEAADIISGALASKEYELCGTLKFLQEITEKPLRRLEELLIAGHIPPDKVRKVFAKIKAKTELKQFFETLDLQQLKDDVATLETKTTNELLADFKKSFISGEKSELPTVKLLVTAIENMLDHTGIPKDEAREAVAHLGHDVLYETLAKIKLVVINLKAIQEHKQKHLLIKFDIISEQKTTITRFIVEALKTVKWIKPCKIYMLAIDWDNEQFFRRLLLENWMGYEHANVCLKLLHHKDDKTKYVQLLLEYNINSNWLTQPHGVLDAEFRKFQSCENLLNKISNSDCKTSNRIMGKVLFIWCIQKQMPETAMLFWKRGQDCLAMALLAYKMSKKKEDELQNKKGYDEMKKQTKSFSNLALDLLKRCYQNNQQNTQNLLDYGVTDLEDKTPSDIASDSNCLAFFYGDPFQDLLNKTWSKDILNYSKWKYIPLLLSEACPLLAPALFDFQRPPDDDNSDVTSNPSDEKQSNTVAHRCTFVRNYFWQVRSFIDTPLVKFSYWFISYIAYLTLFSIVLLTDFQPRMRPKEIVLTFWTAILIIEEVKQAIADRSLYKLNGWNCFDIGAIIMYIIGFILRIVYHENQATCPHCLYVARIVLAFSLIVFFFRTLEFLSVDESLGSKIHMLRGLVADLVSFMLILAVFISAYGVVSNVILYPNQELNAQLLKDVFYDAWWSVLQQFNLDDALGDNCNKQDPWPNISVDYCSSWTDPNVTYAACKEKRCPSNTWIVSVLLAFYALITCIMMLNVLIAMFNKTFERIHKHETKVSKYLRYRLICEYSGRWMVPPPLCVITYPYFITKTLFDYWKEDEDQSESDNETTESAFKDNSNKDVEGGQNSEEPRQSESQPKTMEKNSESKLKVWERAMVAEHCKEIKDKRRRDLCSKVLLEVDQMQTDMASILQPKERQLEKNEIQEEVEKQWSMANNRRRGDENRRSSRTFSITLESGKLEYLPQLMTDESDEQWTMELERSNRGVEDDSEVQETTMGVQDRSKQVVDAVVEETEASMERNKSIVTDSQSTAEERKGKKGNST